jgi:glutamine amidotransferase
VSVRRKTIGIVDYGVGNHASVWQALHSLDFRCRVSADPTVLSESDLLLLPGVGAFRAAMTALHERGLAGYLQREGRSGRPLVGLCLGMQLLADASDEFGETTGLGLIPGRVRPFRHERWHIGWNSIQVMHNDPLLIKSDNQSVYFNHSYVFETHPEYEICQAKMSSSFTVGVRHGKMVGLQFHPEKSQAAGRSMLKNIIEGLCRD